MVTASPKGTWVQCTLCGNIHFIEETVPIDKLYIAAICTKCNNDRAINCGDKKEDVVLYYDPYLDGRYY